MEATVEARRVPKFGMCACMHLCVCTHTVHAQKLTVLVCMIFHALPRIDRSYILRNSSSLLSFFFLSATFFFFSILSIILSRWTFHHCGQGQIVMHYILWGGKLYLKCCLMFSQKVSYSGIWMSSHPLPKSVKKNRGTI